MADVKISQLPAATTPLGGTEQIPLVQGTTTKKVTVSGLFTQANLGIPSAVDLTNATNVPVDQATGTLAVNHGGTGTTTPSIVAGTNVTVTGTWPNQTINSTFSGAVTSVTGTAPVVSSGGATPAISMAAATTSVNGYLTSTDWTTFNNKLATNGSAASLTGLPLTTGVTGLLPVLNGGTGTATPSIVAGTNISVSGTWPNQTINATGSGDVAGPASSTDNAVARFDSTTGKIIQNSGVVINDSGEVTVGVWKGTEIGLSYGGTGASSASQARGNILPAYAGNAGKILAVNSGATDVEYIAAGGVGTVTSVAVSGGTTGLTTSGGPITASGTITLGGTLAVASGGTGTATPSLVAGTNVTITGTWPNQTINSSGGGSMTYPGAGIANSTGSAWGTSYTTSGTGTVVALATGAALTNPSANQINDTNGNQILGLSPTTSAVDYLVVKNGIGVGVPLHIYADGTSANTGLHIQPKGTGLVTISDGTDFNKGIRFRSSSSAASAVTLLDAVSTAGRVVTLPDATTTLVGRDTTDTLTNKTINLTSNTLVATSAQMAAAVSDETGSGSLVFATSPTLVTPILGTPTSGDFSTGTFTWPTFNQNTTGTAAGLSATLAIGSGGTGQTTAAAAITALTGTQTSGQYLRSDGTNAALAAIQAGDVPTLNQNTSGTAAGLSATLAVSSGGTGQTSYTDGQLLIGNSTGNTLTKATLTAGTNVTITNAAGAITIAASGGGASAATPTALGTVYGRYDVANYITYVGNATGNTSSTASHNVGVGSGAMAAITTGTRNIVLGSYAAAALTTGEGNVVLGTFGVGTGTNTFASNTSGSDNIAIGGQSLTANTTASYNIAIGAKALSANTTGTPNLAIGLSSLQANTTGGSNVALGDNTLRSNTTASNNTAVGYQAGYSTTTGTHNAALGYLAGYSNTTGTYNSYIGIGAGYSMTTGSKNTIVGNFSGNSGGIDIRTTSNYIVLSDGDGNVAYYFAGANNFVANDGNFVSGAYSRGTGSQYFTDFRVGWTSNTSVGTQVGYIYSPSGSTTLYTTASDRRLKQNIVDAPSAINDVMAIEIKSFDWISNNEHQKYGVIAQDLHLIAPDAVSIPENAENMCAVDYSVLVPMLIKSIQEIKTEFDAYKATHP